MQTVWDKICVQCPCLGLFPKTTSFWQDLLLQKCPMDLCRKFPVSDLLLSVTSRHYSFDANWTFWIVVALKLHVFNTAIYGKKHDGPLHLLMSVLIPTVRVVRESDYSPAPAIFTLNCAKLTLLHNHVNII